MNDFQLLPNLGTTSVKFTESLPFFVFFYGQLAPIINLVGSESYTAAHLFPRPYGLSQSTEAKFSTIYVSLWGVTVAACKTWSCSVKVHLFIPSLPLSSSLSASGRFTQPRAPSPLVKLQDPQQIATRVERERETSFHGGAKKCWEQVSLRKEPIVGGWPGDKSPIQMRPAVYNG